MKNFDQKNNLKKPNLIKINPVFLEKFYNLKKRSFHEIKSDILSFAKYNKPKYWNIVNDNPDIALDINTNEVYLVPCKGKGKNVPLEVTILFFIN